MAGLTNLLKSLAKHSSGGMDSDGKGRKKVQILGLTGTCELWKFFLLRGTYYKGKTDIA